MRFYAHTVAPDLKSKRFLVQLVFSNSGGIFPYKPIWFHTITNIYNKKLTLLHSTTIVTTITRFTLELISGVVKKSIRRSVTMFTLNTLTPGSNHRFILVKYHIFMWHKQRVSNIYGYVQN
uniref:Uncharacterized protein n=1 Tax=Glossina austeni TaxID=7395 RepID=A0A1A9UWL5_GLOAU